MRISNLQKLKNQHNHEGTVLLTWSNWEREKQEREELERGEEKMIMLIKRNETEWTTPSYP